MSVLIVAVNKVPICAWRGRKMAQRRGPLSWVLKVPWGVYRTARTKGSGWGAQVEECMPVKCCVQMPGGFEGLEIVLEQ